MAKHRVGVGLFVLIASLLVIWLLDVRYDFLEGVFGDDMGGVVTGVVDVSVNDDGDVLYKVLYGGAGPTAPSVTNDVSMWLGDGALTDSFVGGDGEIWRRYGSSTGVSVMLPGMCAAVTDDSSVRAGLLGHGWFACDLHDGSTTYVGLSVGTHDVWTGHGLEPREQAGVGMYEYVLGRAPVDGMRAVFAQTVLEENRFFSIIFVDPVRVVPVLETVLWVGNSIGSVADVGVHEEDDVLGYRLVEDSVLGWLVRRGEQAHTGTVAVQAGRVVLEPVTGSGMQWGSGEVAEMSVDGFVRLSMGELHVRDMDNAGLTRIFVDHVLSHDFLDAKNYPRAVFRIQEGVLGAASELSLVGRLTFKDMTDTLPIQGMWSVSGDVLLMSGSVLLDRMAWGMTALPGIVDDFVVLDFVWEWEKL